MHGDASLSGFIRTVSRVINKPGLGIKLSKVVKPSGKTGG
jgi:hypothetical protein